MENSENFSLNTTYSWFVDTIGKSVKKAACEFFENNFLMSLTSINSHESPKDDPLLKGELFYTCQISIKNKQHVTMRVTSDFIRIVFHDMFGSNYPVFDMEKITELEHRILNGFFEYIVQGISNYIVKENSDTIDPLNKTTLNFVFLIKNKDVNSGKLSVNIPLNRLNPKPVQRTQNFTNEDFINNFAYVDLIAGCSKISLNDLKNLDKDDVLVLEKSDVKSLTLKTPTITHTFKVNPEPSLMIDFEGDMPDVENTVDEYYEENYMPDKSMWDDIQIEVSAEFKRVKMTLGELKQISKGLVIDLGAVMNNEISLLVENKAVAKGELVIINDKYGVRITEVFASSKKQEQAQAPAPAAKPAPQAPKPAAPKQAAPQAAKPAPPKPAPAPQAAKPAPKPAAKPAPSAKPAGKEDFDYSNFEE